MAAGLSVFDVPDPFELAAQRFERQGASKYLYDPLGFVDNCIDWKAGESLTPYQRDIMALMVSKRRLAVRGPHGLGKTTTSALLVIWFALTREAERIDWKIVTTAGAWRQLEFFLWPEIHKWVHRIKWDELGRKPFKRDVEIKKLAIELVYGAATSVAATDPTRIEGAHADSLLYIYDESKIVSNKTFDAAEGAFSGARNVQGLMPEAFALAQSTPGEPQGRFYDIHQRRPGLEDWSVRHVKLYEAIEAGRIAPDWAEQRKLQWGEDSALYANRVKGEFHTSDEDGVIPLAWVESAVERWHMWNNAGRPVQIGRKVLGIDVAYGGRDLSVFATRQGPIVEGIETHNVASTTKIAALAQLASDHPTDIFVVDSIGVGAGVVDNLSAAGRDVVGFQASAKSGMRDRTGQWNFLNCRAAMWWTLRDLLDPSQPGGAEIALPPDDTLIGDLTAPKWWVTAGNRIQVESKEEIRKRIGRSTDYADAVGQCVFYHWQGSGSETQVLRPLRYDDVDRALAAEIFNEDLDGGVYRFSA